MSVAGEQLELDLEVPEADGLVAVPRRAFSRVVGGVLDWAPVWVPLCVLVQLAVGGLGPALAQSRRLDGAEAGVHERVDALRSERALLDEDALRLEDPIFRERVRRSLLVPGGAPLTLERARAEIAEATRLEAEARARTLGPEPRGASEP